jgi:hypothetical protein
VIAGGGLALLAAGVLAARARRQHAADRPRTRPARRGLEPRLVGGSALLTDAIAPERRAQTQGAADLVMGLTAISGNLVAGPLFHAGAFGVLGAGAAALGAFLIVLAARARAPWRLLAEAAPKLGNSARLEHGHRRRGHAPRRNDVLEGALGGAGFSSS